MNLKNKKNLKVAPNFKLLSTNDNVIELKKLKNKYVLIYFYPKDDTPGCTIETKDFNSLLSKVAHIPSIKFSSSIKFPGQS